MTSLLGYAQKRGLRAAPLWQVGLISLISEIALTVSALSNSPALRQSLTVGTLTVAVMVLPAIVLRRDDLRTIASDAAGSSLMSDLILLGASLTVWRGQTAYEEMAMEWFRVLGTAAFGISAVGLVVAYAWLVKKPSIPSLLVTASQWAGSSAQLLLASVLFPHSPRPQLVYTVPLFLTSGFAQQLFWDLAIDAPVAPQPPAEQRTQPKPVPAQVERSQKIK